MNAGVINRTKKYFAIALVSIVGLLTINNALFLHMHRLANGSLVVHAHPFSKSNQTDSAAKSHQHSKVEFQFLDSLLLLFANNISTTEIVISTNWQEYIFNYQFSNLENSPQKITNKAPPSIV
jgi:hypothetical protein